MKRRELAASAAAVQAALEGSGLELVVVQLSQSTRTAAEAAEAVGCQVGQIAKSLIFEGAQSGQAVLVIASGRNRVDESRVAELIGEQIQRASPEFVRQATGFAIGGVPPCGHVRRIETVLIDRDLLDHAEIWAAAGTPNALFKMQSRDLPLLTGGEVAIIKEV